MLCCSGTILSLTQPVRVFVVPPTVTSRKPSSASSGYGTRSENARQLHSKPARKGPPGVAQLSMDTQHQKLEEHGLSLLNDRLICTSCVGENASLDDNEGARFSQPVRERGELKGWRSRRVRIVLREGTQRVMVLSSLCCSFVSSDEERLGHLVCGPTVPTSARDRARGSFFHSPADRRTRHSGVDSRCETAEEALPAPSPPYDACSLPQTPRVPYLRVSRSSPGLQQCLDDIQRRRKASGDTSS